MSSPDPTLLLQDLLSPPAPNDDQQRTLRLVSYHLASVPLESPHLGTIALIVRYALTSTSLWAGTSRDQHYQRDEAGVARAIAIHTAFFQATLLRLDAISQDVGQGYRARRAVSSFLSTLSSGLWADAVLEGDERETGWVEPVHRLLVASAILAALQEWKRRKEKLWVGGRGMLDRIESETGRAWQDWITHGGKSLDQLPAWIAAQTIPAVSPSSLAKEFPSTSLLNYLADEFAAVFNDGDLFTSPPLIADLRQAEEGLDWPETSTSYAHLSRATQTPLFGLLGPLSRALGRLLSSNAELASRYDPALAEPAVAAIRSLSHSVFLVTTRLSSGWAATPWSELVDDSALSPPTRSRTQPWTILKSLLFAQTLIYSSLLEVVSSTASDAEDEPTVTQRELAREAVVALGKTYFVASRFGQGGFRAWRAVLAGLVDVAAAPSPSSAALGHDRISPAEQLAREMETTEGDDPKGRHSNLVERAEATFWMNTVEQVMEELSDSYVESTVLRRAKPYLEEATYPESFESAHSVVLAIFSSGKACVPAFVPYYTQLLLLLPDLSATQLRVAYSTMVRSASIADDALAWWCIRELLAAIDRLPVSVPPSERSLLLLPATHQTPSMRDLSEDSIQDSASTTSPAANDTIAPPTLETRALELPRGNLLLTLISLLPTVNFVLFRSLLGEISRLVKLEPVEHDGRKALAEWIFDVLGSGMDVVKREEGIRWWLENGRSLLEAEKLDSGELEADITSSVSEESRVLAAQDT
ncbi:uncharacterized protein JCM15063_003891 [Sporobolomyces koalae]|uniref:uncharacterized protein n=1 Tax=Sporobolomyces koalae TaxID=500713 RepID=UPI00316F4C68